MTPYTVTEASPTSDGSLSILAVTNIYPTLQAPSSGTFVKSQVESLRHIGLTVDVMRVNRDEAGRSVYRRLPNDLKAALAHRRYDLIHVMYGGVMADQVTKSADLPVVVSFCGSDLNGTPLAPLPARISGWYGVWSSRRAAQRAAAVIAKTQLLASKVPPSVAGDKIFVIPNGVDLDRFGPLERETCLRQLGWDLEHRHVLFYGSHAGKRVELAREAVQSAEVRSGISIDLRVLAGVAHDEVPTWINGCHAVLVTSMSEGSPNIVKEALACDVPVISTDVGDVRERIEGVAGCFLVAPDVNEIASALTEVVNGSGRVEGRPAVADISTVKTAHRVANVYRFALGLPGS